MSLIYPDKPAPYDDRVQPAVEAEPFVPVYARKRSSRGKGGVKTWMILAPVGALALAGIAAALIMGGGEETAEPVLAESAATLPVLPATPVAPAAALSTPALTIDTTDVPPAVAVREQAPVRRATPAPARRVVPAPARPAATATTTTRVETPAQSTSPQPYAASPSASTPIPAPTPTLPVEPRQPAIVTQPLE